MYIASLCPERPYRAISLHGHYTRPRTDGSGAAFSPVLGLSFTEDDGAWRRPIRRGKGWEYRVFHTSNGREPHPYLCRERKDSSHRHYFQRANGGQRLLSEFVSVSASSAEECASATKFLSPFSVQNRAVTPWIGYSGTYLVVHVITCHSYNKVASEGILHHVLVSFFFIETAIYP